MTAVSRRQFVQGVGGVGLALVAGCALPISAPPAAQVRRIAYFAGNPPSAANEARVLAFRQGMRDLGYVQGQNLLLELHHAAARDQLAAPAAEMVRRQPEVILVSATAIARVVQTATTIPIVSAGTGTGGADLEEHGDTGEESRRPARGRGFHRGPARAAEQLRRFAASAIDPAATITNTTGTSTSTSMLTGLRA